MRSRIAGLCVTAVVFASSSLAQNFGEITGTVTDQSGAIVVGSVITITSTTTNQTRRVETNENGGYSAPYLVPGVYNVVATNTGFKSSNRPDVSLQVGMVARINFVLEVGDATQLVEVTAGAPLLSTESTALGTVIENRRIVELPLNGRNYLQLVALSPNVTTEGGAGGPGSLQGGERSRTSLSIAGQRLEFNRYTLDGIENTDVNFNSYVIQPSIDAVQEFKVQTGVYSAEFGRATSQISATTKSGANQFHGTAFEFLRNNVFDAKEWRQDGPQNPFRRNQFGFTLGGRLIRDRLFFMSNFEALRDRKTIQQTASVPTLAMRNGDFSGQERAVYDPLTRVYTTSAEGVVRAVSATQFANNVIPRSRVNPIAIKLLEFYPEPTVPGNSILRNYLRNVSRPISAEQFNQRIDWTESASSNWFGRYSWGDEYVGDSPAFETVAGRVETKVQQAVLSNTRVFGATKVNEARFGWNNFNNDRLGHFAGIRNVASELGIIGLSPANPESWGVPAIGLGNGLNSFGGGEPFVTRNHTFQFLDNFSWINGRHTIKFGGESRRDRYNQLGNQKAPGEFLHSGRATFDPANRNATGHAYADFLIGEVSEAARALQVANGMLRASSYYAYIQDDWKITPRLTLNLGLRYENTRPWKDKYRGIMNVQMFDPGVGANGLLPASETKVPILTRPGSGDFYEGLAFRFHDGIPIQAGDQFIGRSLVNPDNNDFAPRFGVAYSPTDRWTFRTGFGLFYTKDSGNVVFDMTRNLAGRGLFNSDEEVRNSNISDPWASQRSSSTCTGWTGTCLGPPQILGNIVGRRTPYVMQWLFNIQRQLTDNVAVEIGYMGNGGRKLERFRTYNQAILKTGPNDSRSIAQRSPWPAYGRIQEVDGSVNSNYHALSGKIQQRFSRGLSYMVAYTYSKAIDGGSALRTNSGDRLWPINSYDLRQERGPSQFHVGQRFVSSALYELPFGRANSGFLKRIIEGWQVGGILTVSGGTPVNVGAIGDSFAVGGLGNTIHATGISPIPEHQTVDQFWNVAAFNPNDPSLSYLAGNAGSRVLTTPGVFQLDGSLTKNFAIREGHALQFRWEAFNATNHPNWNAPATDARNASTFGRIVSARTMREMQLALKYIF